MYLIWLYLLFVLFVYDMALMYIIWFYAGTPRLLDRGYELVLYTYTKCKIIGH